MTKEELNKNIGERIRSLREYYHFTRENLAEYADISVQFLADIEGGRKSMTTTVLYNMCKALHVPADYILFGTTTETSPNSMIPMMLSTITPEEQACAEHILQYYIQGLSFREKNVYKPKL